MIYYCTSILHTLETLKEFTRSTIQKWHRNSPLFNNYSLSSGAKPFQSKQWEEKEIFVLGDILTGLLSFTELQTSFKLSTSSFFMKAYGYHGMNLSPLFINNKEKKSTVSQIYKLLLIANYEPLQREKCGNDLNIDLEDDNGDKCGRRLQTLPRILITNSYISIFYIELPLHLMRLVPNALCNHCCSNAVGAYIHTLKNVKKLTCFGKTCQQKLVTQFVFPCWSLCQKDTYLWIYGLLKLFSGNLIASRHIPFQTGRFGSNRTSKSIAFRFVYSKLTKANPG